MGYEEETGERRRKANKHQSVLAGRVPSKRRFLSGRGTHKDAYTEKDNFIASQARSKKLASASQRRVQAASTRVSTGTARSKSHKMPSPQAAAPGRSVRRSVLGPKRQVPALQKPRAV